VRCSDRCTEARNTTGARKQTNGVRVTPRGSSRATGNAIVALQAKLIIGRQSRPCLVGKNF